MALNLGTLAGVLTLDDGPFGKALDNAEGKLSGAKTAFAAAALGIAGAIGGALAVGIAEGMNLEKANDKLAAQLRLTEEESERVGGVAGSLFADAYGSSMEEVNEALRGVIQQVGGLGEITDEELTQAGASALNLADILGTDVTRLVQVAGQAVSTGLASDMTEAFDLIAAASAETMPGLEEDLLDAIDEYSPFFQSLGIEGDAAFGMLAKASEKGMYGIDKTGDAIKEFTIRATDMSASSTEAFDAIGMDAQEMSNKILQGGDVSAGAFEDIIDGLMAIKDPTEQASAAIALFGAPLEDLSVSEIPSFLESLTSAESGLNDVEGAADEMGGTLRDNASTNIESFKRGLTETFVEVAGNTVIPKIQEVAGWLSGTFGPAFSSVATTLSTQVIPALKSVIEWVKENQTWLMIVAGLITAVFVPAWIAMGVQATIAGGKTVAAWVMQKAAAIGSVAVQSAQIALMVGKWILMGTTAMINGARMAAAWVLGMGPIGWIIAAVIAAVALIIYYWDEIVAGLEAAWTWVSDLAVSIWNGILAFFEEWGPLIFAILTGGISLVVTWIIENWETIEQTTIDIFTAIGDFFVGIWEWIVGVFQGAIDTAKGIFNWFAGLGAMFRDWFNQARDGAVDKLISLINWVKGLPGKVTSAIGNVARLLWDKGKDVIAGLLNGMKNAASAIWNWITELLGGIADKVKDFFGISSPSRLMRRFGGDIGTGLALGIKDSLTGVVASAELMAEAAAPEIRGPVYHAPSFTASATLGYQDRMLIREMLDANRKVEFHVDARGSKYGPEEMRRDMALAEV